MRDVATGPTCQSVLCFARQAEWQERQKEKKAYEEARRKEEEEEEAKRDPWEVQAVGQRPRSAQ